MAKLDNQKLSQAFLILLIFALGFIVSKNLVNYLSAFLGALTFYILFRNIYLYLHEKKKWKDWLSAGIIMIGATVVILIPFGFLGFVLAEKIIHVIAYPEPLLQQWEILTNKIHELTGYNVMSIDTLKQLLGPISSFVPNMLGNTFMILMNFAFMYFILYFMFINGKDMERFFDSLFPMSNDETQIVSKKAKDMIISNTIVIPMLAVIQGFFSYIGYKIFHVDQAMVMGILTGITSVIPMVGTMIIWIPLSLILIFQNEVGMGVGLLIYGGLVITNIDNVVRFILQKKIANVHPLITVFGVIIGVNMFGFVGLIIGPTLISILLLLIELYVKEFGFKNQTPP